MIRLLVSSARSWNASGLLMTLNAFIGRLRNNVCLCSNINVSIIKTKALLTSIAINQTCIGTRETDDLRSQLMRRTTPSRRTPQSATLGPCAGWIRGLGGGRYDDHPAIHLDCRQDEANPHDGPRPVRSGRIRGPRWGVARRRRSPEPFRPWVARNRERRSPAAPVDAGDQHLHLLDSSNFLSRESSGLSAPSTVARMWRSLRSANFPSPSDSRMGACAGRLRLS